MSKIRAFLDGHPEAAKHIVPGAAHSPSTLRSPESESSWPLPLSVWSQMAPGEKAQINGSLDRAI